MQPSGSLKFAHKKVEARRNECRNGLLFPPEQFQITTATARRKAFLLFFFRSRITPPELLEAITMRELDS
jgi:hypothetical protein